MGKFYSSLNRAWILFSWVCHSGVFCSWMGTFLWNKASESLPVSFAGQLTIFETIFGLLFFYLLQNKLPPIQEIIGVTLMLAAILYGMNIFITKEPVEE